MSILPPERLTRSPMPHRLPYGAMVQEGGTQFTVYSRSATGMRLLLYDALGDREPSDVLAFDPQQDRIGDVWTMFVPGLGHGQLYHFQADGPFDPHRGHRFDGRARLIDPWAQALAGDFLPSGDSVLRPPRCVVIDDDFDWEDDRRPKRPLGDTIIYEMHVGGLTKHRSSDVDHPGTYLGVIEKIPYLQSLGVTAVELLPVHEFPILAPNGQRLSRPNYWGYDPMAFFAPHRGFAEGREPGAQVAEFKHMVKALHAAGIEVLLDVVFNHTCEGNENGPTLSFKGLENNVYYTLTGDKAGYMNFSGCGNTVNCNHPVVREFIVQCLRHWVLEYHVDGFRFDLASILTRGPSGEVLGRPPLVEAIDEDPILADVKLIAEAWDAAGLYQVGSFPGRRWAEWNGRYRDDIRRYWRGDPKLAGALASRLTGSSDMYQHSGRRPQHSVNFITSHDGFTMNDLVSYNHKHNASNGEDNRDGDNNNCSYNHGVEGPTSVKAIETTRIRQIKNMQATLLLSLGVPMIVAGDECRRTQRGNNNAYCQDNVISWFNWRLLDKHAELARFVRGLMHFRLTQPTVRRRTFKTGQPPFDGALPDASWYSPEGHPMAWDTHDSSLIAVLGGSVPLDSTADLGNDLLLVFHPGPEDRRFHVPQSLRARPWRTFLDTAAEMPDDLWPGCNGPPVPADGTIDMLARSLRVFVAAPLVVPPSA
jgi:glycogen operon protein